MTDDLPDRVAVIGSGPCGAIAAHVLVNRGVPVTMFESGAMKPRGVLIRAAGNTLFRWMPQGDLRSDGGFDDAMRSGAQWWRELAPGGLSNHWTAAVPRFSPADFGQGDTTEGIYRWPVDYDQMVPYYELVEPLLAIAGSGTAAPNIPANVIRHQVALPPGWNRIVGPAETRGLGVTSVPMARGARWMAVARGTEFNSWTSIVDQLTTSEIFEVELGSHVTNLRWSPSSGRVDAIDYLDRATGRAKRRGVRSVVLAAGDLNSTKLLLSSISSEFPDGLGNEGDLLGRFLHDHPRQYWTFATTERLRLPGDPVLMTGRHADAAEPLLAASWMIGLANKRDRLRTHVRASGAAFGVQMFGTMTPRHDHRVELADGPPDEFGQPRLRLSIEYDDPTVRNMAWAREQLAEVFREAGFGYQAHEETVHELQPGSSVHYAGSVRMHANPEFGVLDSWNRIHSVPNVVVVDKSCFTTSPEKNPTLTAMALAARAADHLADELL